jgi:hypothetical protein
MDLLHKNLKESREDETPQELKYGFKAQDILGQKKIIQFYNNRQESGTKGSFNTSIS